MEVDNASIPGLVSFAELKEQRSVGRLKRLDDHWYICLCTEDTYQLMADTTGIKVPHPINLNAGLVESEFEPAWAAGVLVVAEVHVSVLHDSPVV